MLRLLPTLLIAACTSLGAAPALANDFPTSARVEFVTSCMNQHQGKHEYLYKCSCAIDHMAKAVSHDEFVDIVTAARTVSLQGALVSQLRQVAEMQDMARKFVTIQKDAYAACNLPEPKPVPR